MRNFMHNHSRSLLIIALGSALTFGACSGSSSSSSEVTTKKLLGKWKVVHTAKGLDIGEILEFAADGKMTQTSRRGNETRQAIRSYHLDQGLLYVDTGANGQIRSTVHMPSDDLLLVAELDETGLSRATMQLSREK